MLQFQTEEEPTKQPEEIIDMDEVAKKETEEESDIDDDADPEPDSSIKDDE